MNFTCPYCNCIYDFSRNLFGSKLECAQCGNFFFLDLKPRPTPRRIFLDIETTGFHSSNAELTTVVWYGDGIWGNWSNNGMSASALEYAWSLSDELVTFNGRKFDEPWILEFFGLPRHANHIDLLDETSRKGLSGGLKEITKRLGIPRPSELDSMEGKHAPKLWKSASKGNKCSLCNLLYYNAWDVVLTYKLFCLLRELDAESIEESIPFGHKPEALKVFTTPNPQPFKQSADTKAKPLKELWQERQKVPLLRLQEALVCFTGDIEKCEREEAENLVVTLGGTVKKSVVQRLDFLVLGDTGEYGKTGKIKKVEEYIGRGAHTQIITESEFWALVEKSQER